MVIGSMDKHPLDGVLSNLDVELSSRVGKKDILKLEGSMRSLVVEMKVMNTHLRIVTGNEIKEEDLDEVVR